MPYNIRYDYYYANYIVRSWAVAVHRHFATSGNKSHCGTVLSMHEDLRDSEDAPNQVLVDLGQSYASRRIVLAKRQLPLLTFIFAPHTAILLFFHIQHFLLSTTKIALIAMPIKTPVMWSQTNSHRKTMNEISAKRFWSALAKLFCAVRDGFHAESLKNKK